MHKPSPCPIDPAGRGRGWSRSRQGGGEGVHRAAGRRPSTAPCAGSARRQGRSAPSGRAAGRQESGPARSGGTRFKAGANPQPLQGASAPAEMRRTPHAGRGWPAACGHRPRYVRQGALMASEASGRYDTAGDSRLVAAASSQCATGLHVHACGPVTSRGGTSWRPRAPRQHMRCRRQKFEWRPASRVRRNV